MLPLFRTSMSMTVPRNPRVRRRLITFVALAALLTGCSASDALNVFIPSDGYVEYRDISYGPSSRQALNVYEPSAAAPSSGRTVVVFLYGGSWRGGKRETYKFVGEALTSKGYVAVIPDYRVYPEAVYPMFVEDAAAALKWTVENAHQYGGDKDRIVLMGHSAGAHIASLLALDPQFLNRAGLPASSIKGVIGLAGPYSFDPLQYRVTRAVFGHLSDPQVARPVIYAKNPAPPMLLLHGRDDTTVGPHNSADLADALRVAGNAVTTKVYEDEAHIGIILALAAPFRSRAPTLLDSAAFIDSLFASTPPSAHAAQ
jgi:acetyl esterase/lipase